MHQFVFLGVLPVIALAGRISPPMLLRRTDPKEPTTCEEMNLKPCGTGCIHPSYTCCPGQSGGCPVDKHCVVGDDNKEGCCKNDYVCTGNGGVSYTTFSLTSTAPDSTVLAPEPATTTTEVDSASSYSKDLPTPTSTDVASTTSTETAQSSASTEESSSYSITSAVSSTETASSTESTSTTASAASSTSTDVSRSTSVSSTGTSQGSTSNTTLSTTSSTTSYSISTIYTTTTKTITSCPASHPCHQATHSPHHNHITVITETIAVSTTFCLIIESPPLPTPTPTISLAAQSNPGQNTTTITVVEPPVTPDVVCPGEGRACHVVTHNPTGSVPLPVVEGTSTGRSSSSSVRTAATATAKGNGTASAKATATAIKGAVTAGAARVGGGIGMGSVMAVIAGLLGVAVGQVLI